MRWLILLLIACGGEPEANLASKIEATFIDTWFYTEDELPWIGAPSCGILSSNGTAEAFAPDGKYMGPVDWVATGKYEVKLSHDLLTLGTLKFREDVDSWNIEYDGFGYHGVISATPDCPYEIIE